MADHKIYIYASNGIQESSDGSNAFKPFSNKEESVFSEIKSGIEGTQSFVTGGFQSIISGGVAALGRVLPAVALATLVVGITDKVVSTGFDHLEEYKGDYRYDMMFNNLKTGLMNSINPIGLFFKQMHRNMQFQKRNVDIQMQRTLIGNTIINDGKLGV